MNTTIPRQNPTIPWNIMTIFFLLFLSFLTAGIIFYTIEKGNIKEEKYNELSAISSLKVAQIRNWYMERRGDASVIMQDHNFGNLFNRWLTDRNDPYFPVVFNDLASSLSHYYSYSDVILAGTSGEILFTINKSLKLLGPETKSFIARVIATNEVVFTDFYRCSTCNQVHLDIMAPIAGNIGGKSVTTGVIILRIDPGHDVYAMIQSWPTPSKTAETLLVRREAKEIVFLNELRHRKHTALQLRFPITRNSLPAVMAAEGKEGIVEGIDYRNVPVLADIRHIPDMPWYIVAKVDIDEIYAPIRGLLAGVIAVTALLIAAAAGGLSWWWNQQRLNFYKLKYESEAKYRALEMQFENLTRFANDIIIVSDENLKIMQVNEVAVNAYGYTRDDLLNKSIRDIRSPAASRDFQEQLREAKEQGGLIYETLHRRKDESDFPVEISLRYLEYDDKKYFLGIIRDITERKAAEAALYQSEELFRTIFDYSTVGKSLTALDGKLMKINRAFADMLGYSIEEAQEINFFSFTHPDDIALSREGIRCLLAGEQTSYQIEKRYIHKNGNIIWADMSTMLYRDRNGKPLYFITSVINITDRKRAEENIRMLFSERELLLKEVHHRIKNNMTMIASLLGLQASRLSKSEASEALNESRNRVMSMAAIYDILFRTIDFRYVSVKEYLGQVIDGIIASLPAVAGVTTEKRIDDFVMDSKVMFPIGIIINELVTNSYKYAFPKGRTGTITISVSRLPENNVEIIVSDNGTGIPENIDIDAQSGFGMKLVTMLVQQIEGTFECVRGGGTLFRINFQYIGGEENTGSSTG